MKIGNLSSSKRGENTHWVRPLKCVKILGKDGGIWRLSVEPLELVALPQDQGADMLDSCLLNCPMLLPEQSWVEIHVVTTC